ncbi:MAG: UDP-N-acetylmuramoyl-tripeptide--D-alanyl-D-alanine ligase [bacterium]|nr:UDP-N-acetylmuramoyl-tripeptide--D-alanyl-D-alanine ligase [bacterium]
MKVFKSLFHNSRRIAAKLWLLVHPRVEVIGITGSYGKTYTTAAVFTVLAQKFKVLATDTNLDTRYNIPITVLKLSDHQKLVLEYGVDKPGEMDAHLFVARPKIAIITGITPVHADASHLGSLENIIKEKSKLAAAVPRSGWVIVNWDDQMTRQIADVAKGKVIFYGRNRYHCQFWISHIKTSFKGTSFKLHFRGSSHVVKTPLIGRHHAYTATTAAIIGVISGLKWREITIGLANLVPLDGRGNLEPGPKETVILNDSRRANPASAVAGLQILADLLAKRKIAVIGEMGELGKYEEEGHRNVGKKAAETRPDYLICVGPATKYIAEEARRGMKKDRVIWVKDVFEAAGVLSGILRKGDLWYLKGSLLKHLERIPLIIDGKDIDPDEVAFKRYEVYR